MNRIRMFPEVKMIISVLLPPPCPQPRTEEPDSKVTCDRGAQEGKTFENVLVGQPARHCFGSYCPGPFIQLQFWEMQGQRMMSSAQYPSPLTLRNKARACSLIWKDLKKKKKQERGCWTFYRLFPTIHKNTAVKINTTPQTRVSGHQQSSSSSLPCSSCHQHRLAQAETHWAERGRSGGDPSLSPKAGLGASTVTTHPGRGKAPDRLFPS